MQHTPVRSECCEKGALAIVWRVPRVNGPEHEGWSMVLHTFIGPPEYANIIVCPFCGQKPLNKEQRKQ